MNKDQHMVGFAVGGPLIAYSDQTIPMPLSSVSYGYGLTTNTSVFGGVHTTALLFGVFQSDIGVCTNIYRNNTGRFGFSASPIVNVAVDKWKHNRKAWPALDLNAYWTLRPGKVLTYAGIANWLELAGHREDGARQARRLFINPHLGATYYFRNWSLNAEMKYLAPDLANQPNVVEYTGIDGRGALGIYFGINRILK